MVLLSLGPIVYKASTTQSTNESMARSSLRSSLQSIPQSLRCVYCITKCTVNVAYLCTEAMCASSASSVGNSGTPGSSHQSAQASLPFKDTPDTPSPPPCCGCGLLCLCGRSSPSPLSIPQAIPTTASTGGAPCKTFFSKGLHLLQSVMFCKRPSSFGTHGVNFTRVPAGSVTAVVWSDKVTFVGSASASPRAASSDPSVPLNPLYTREGRGVQ